MRTMTDSPSSASRGGLPEKLYAAKCNTAPYASLRTAHAAPRAEPTSYFAGIARLKPTSRALLAYTTCTRVGRGCSPKCCATQTMQPK